MSAVAEKVFDLKLQDPKSKQFRLLSVSAADEAHAKEQAAASELDIVQFSLLPPEKEYWECPPGSTDDDSNGLVDLSRWDARHPDFLRATRNLPYSDAVRAAERRLDDMLGKVDFAPSGKIRHHNLTPIGKARLAHHLQDEPFEVVECNEVTDVMRSISDAGFEGFLEMQRIAKKIEAANNPRWNPDGWSAFIEDMRQRGWPIAVLARIHGVGVLAQDTGGTPIVWGTGTGGDAIHVALLTSFTADPDTQNAWDDVSGTQVTGTGYTTLGVALAGKAVTYDTTTDQTRLDANDAQWTTSTISAQDAAIFKNTGTPSTSVIYGTVDFEATVATTAGTFQITWDAAGVITRDYT
jgi:hypothetical protein